MIIRRRPCWVALAVVSSCWAQGQGGSVAGQTQAKDSATDPTQNIVSALGMGTGATLAVTQKGTSVTAAIGRQIVNSPINFWQVGVVGTLDKNDQQEVYSSRDADAPGFKGKVGFGYSSLIKLRLDWHHTGGIFYLHGWCLDMIEVIGKGMPEGHAPNLKTMKSCGDAVTAASTALTQFPPQDINGQVDKSSLDLDNAVLKGLTDVAKSLDDATNAQTIDNFSKAEISAGTSQIHLCTALTNAKGFSDVCSKQPSVNDEQKKYPALDQAIPVKGAPGPVQWKAWASWAPTVSSSEYRPLVNGVYDLSNKQYWTKLLNAGVGDIALYYKRYALGLEGGYGQTVKIIPQNVCNNTTNGTYTAQQCDMAMLGEPKPVSAWLISAALQVTPIPIFGNGVPLSPGLEATFSYTAPRSGGHSSELAFPIFLAPSTSPLSFVFGLQPTWDWNTDPKVGNKFYISLFVGARPPVPTPTSK